MSAFRPYRLPRLPEAEMLARAAAFHAHLDARRSVRSFSEEPVPRALIEWAIRAAGTAPSGAHRQPWHFVAVSSPTVKARIREAAEAEERRNYEGGRLGEAWLEALAPLGTGWRKPHLERAPWLVVVFAEQHSFNADGSQRHNYYVKESVGIACGLFIAALHEVGLATLTHTPSPMAFLSGILERPSHERPYILFPVGHPAEDCRVPDLQRKALDELCTWHED